MQLRRVPALAAATAVLALGLTACAQQVPGNPVAARDTSAGESSASAPRPTRTSTAPSATKPSARRPSTTAEDSPTATGRPAGEVKITQRKKTTGFEDCDILSPEEVASTIGAQKGGEKGCLQTTEGPFVVVLLMVTVADHQGDARQFELGGNTAYQIDEQGGDCTVMVMLTDDPEAITPALTATVTPVEGADTCAVALKLATKAFEKIPNA